MVILGCPVYHRYEGKILNDILKTILVPSIAECVQLCYETDGCLAINIRQNNDVICELTTGLRNDNEMEDNEDYLLLLRGTFQ